MTLHRYFAWRFFLSFLAVFGIFFALLAMIDLIEQIRSFGGSGQAGLGDLLGLTLLNIPSALYRILPLILVIAAIALFLSLARSSELVVTRAAGRSALMALLAPALVALGIGLVGTFVFNPIVAATSREYEARAADLGRTGTSVFSIFERGLWLRQGAEGGQTVIRAARANLDGTELADVTFLSFDAEGRPVTRIAAASAALVPGAWAIRSAKVWDLGGAANPEASAREEASLSLPSTLTGDEIRNSFGTPSSIPVWDLPGFIARLEAAGFSARRHRVFLQTELALPLFLVAMVLVAAPFTLRPQRGGRTGILVMAAVLLAFAVYILRNFAVVMGENGQIPAALAAWAPPLAAIGIALGLLLHLEDG